LGDEIENVQETAGKLLHKKMEKAARLLAEDRLTDVQVAAECQISERTLYTWKKRDDFIARVNEMLQAYSARALGTGIAARVRRIETLKLLNDKMLTIIAERGEDLSMAAIPGGRTGLIVRDYVTVRTESGRIGTVAVYGFDRGLSAEIRAVGEQVARELGQWMPETQQVDSRPRALPKSTAELEAPLHKKMEKAARLLAEDRLTDVQIAAECQISQRSLYTWKKREDFIARVNAMLQAYSSRALGTGIATRVRRIETLKLLNEKMLTIMAERGEDLTMAAIPGGRTGLMVRDYVTVRTESGKIGTVATYAFDRGLSAELRAVGEQVARELEQWMPETQQVNEVKVLVVYETPDGKPINTMEMKVVDSRASNTPLALPEAKAELEAAAETETEDESSPAEPKIIVTYEDDAEPTE
jgi:gas vesicle protein